MPTPGCLRKQKQKQKQQKRQPMPNTACVWTPTMMMRSAFVAVTLTMTMTMTTMMVLLLPREASGFSSLSLSAIGIRHEMSTSTRVSTTGTQRNMSDDWSDSGNDPNKWTSSNSNSNSNNNNNPNDWNDDSWSTFASLEDENENDSNTKSSSADPASSDADVVDDSEAWLDVLASISAEEIEFNQRDNERAEKARQMQEWGFDGETIRNTFGVAVDSSKETADDPEGLTAYRETLQNDLDFVLDEADFDAIESHTRVEIDPETGEPIRQQMVYVDEHACIGCTNCATMAESTFFMESGFGRARVFHQWGDTEEAISVAIESCPVDCIHYVPYNELVALEVDRRGQRINNQARLVNQGEGAHMASTGGSQFTAPQKISGNAGSRCNNCPTAGCQNCPMFGVGKNPEYERKERERLAKAQRRKLERERADTAKSIEL